MIQMSLNLMKTKTEIFEKRKYNYEFVETDKCAR